MSTKAAERQAAALAEREREADDRETGSWLTNPKWWQVLLGILLAVVAVGWIPLFIIFVGFGK